MYAFAHLNVCMAVFYKIGFVAKACDRNTFKNPGSMHVYDIRTILTMYVDNRSKIKVRLNVRYVINCTESA